MEACTSMQLTGDQLAAFHQALLAAFPTRPALARLVRFGLETPLETIGEGPSLPETLSPGPQGGGAKGKLDPLLRPPLVGTPTNPPLAAFAPQVAPGLVPLPPAAPAAPPSADLMARIAA